MVDERTVPGPGGNAGYGFFPSGGESARESGEGILVLAYPSGTVCRPADPSGRIGAFARAHWYKVVAGLLKDRERERRNAANAGPAPEIHCNSNRMDEKLMAVSAGAGFIGKHSLLVHPGYGPRCVIGVLARRDAGDIGRAKGVPDDAFVPGGMCGSCDACVQACPTGAILPGGGIQRDRCLQFYASRDIPLPRELLAVWGDRLYGCDACSDACPVGAVNGDKPDADSPGYLGEWVELSFVLSASREALENGFKGTALGMKFVSRDALRRNALLAAGHCLRRPCDTARHEDLLELVERYAENENAALSSAARYSIHS